MSTFSLLRLVAIVSLVPLGMAWTSGSGWAQAEQVDVVRVEGGPIETAELRSITLTEDNSTATFRSDQGEVTMHLARLIRWGHVSPPQSPLLLLADGSRLTATEALQPLRIGEDRLRADTAMFGELAIPLEILRGVALNLPLDPLRRRTLLESIQQTSRDAGQLTTDRLLLRNGDELAGTIIGWEDDAIEIVAGGRTTQIEVGQVAGVSFNPALAQKLDPPPRRVAIGFADGTLILAQQLSTVGNDLQITALLANTLSVKLDQVTFVQPFGFGAVYLSEMEAAGYKHVPFLDLGWDYRRDANVAGGPLVAGGREYLKGLGMHSPARITYRLNGEFSRFQASLAIDGSTGNRGSVTCRVYIDDGGGAWKPVFTSNVIRGGQPPTAVNVDISGARQISLLVDHADRGDQLDHLNWLDARVVP